MKMMGANEALRFLNYRLDLSDPQTTHSEKDYVTMMATSPYLSFRPINAFLRSEEQFGLVASTPPWLYEDVSDPKFFENDEIGLASYMAKDKPKELAEIKSHSASILSRAEEKIKSYRDKASKIAYHWYSPGRTYSKRNKIKMDAESFLSSEFQKDLESLKQEMNQKVQLSDRAFVEISAKSGGFNCGPLYGDEKEYIPTAGFYRWLIMSKLSASMPSKIDENNALVKGISNTLDFVELSVPAINPSIIAKIERLNPFSWYINGTKQNNDRSYYQFKLKDSGIEEQDVERMVRLLLI